MNTIIILVSLFAIAGIAFAVYEAVTHDKKAHHKG